MVYALVKWLYGRERGTHTVVNGDWLLEVDIKTFDNSEGSFIASKRR